VFYFVAIGNVQPRQLYPLGRVPGAHLKEGGLGPRADFDAEVITMCCLFTTIPHIREGVVWARGNGRVKVRSGKCKKFLLKRKSAKYNSYKAIPVTGC
jgi:hypothetical protein